MTKNRLDQGNNIVRKITKLEAFRDTLIIQLSQSQLEMPDFANDISNITTVINHLVNKEVNNLKSEFESL